MKSARHLAPTGPYQERLREFDLREIDAEDRRSLFHRKYMARLTRVMGIIQRELPPGSRVLEVGCSQANASLLLAERGYLSIGLDIRPAALQYARSKYEHGEFHCVTGSAEALPLAADSLDVVIIGELLEHCAQPVAIIHECMRPIRTGGILVITTPNGGYVGLRHDPRYRPDVPPEDELAQRQFLPDTHVGTFTRASLWHLLAAAGLEVLHCAYVGSALYSDRFSPLKRLFSPERLDALSHLLNRLPGLNHLFSYTLVAVARKR